ncbi:MAG: ATP-binding protein [Desulfobulbaceae bacterium]|nr:ATP-binding protein [Desulfobulbaceae bacterium]
MNRKGTLFFFCGKMGAGKSTYSKNLANELSAVFLSEDDAVTLGSDHAN